MFSESRFQFVAIGPAKHLKIGQQVTFLLPKWVFNWNFALSREIIHDRKCSFMHYS